LGRSVHTVKEDADALVVVTKEIEIEVNADKAKYMVMSRDRNAGRDDSVKIDNSFIERVEDFRYLGTMLAEQNSIQEEIKRRLKLENACYHSVQTILSSRLLSKTLKFKIYRNIILDLQEVGGGRGDWMELAQDRDRWRALVGTVRDLRVP
jgi:hypothetical protein